MLSTECICVLDLDCGPATAVSTMLWGWEDTINLGLPMWDHLAFDEEERLQREVNSSLAVRI